MPSFMIGDILEPKRNIQMPLKQAESWEWGLPPLKDHLPMDLCTRLPFSIAPWLSTQQLTAGHRFTQQEILRPDDKVWYQSDLLKSFPDLISPGYSLRELLEPDNLVFRQTSSASQHSFSMMSSVTTTSTLHSSDSIHEEGSAGKSKKTRKARTAFSDHQLNELERTFEKQKYLSVQDRMQLAEKLHLSDMQVKTWYQNRRTKWKRQASVGMGHLMEATTAISPLFQQEQVLVEYRKDFHRLDLSEPLSALMMQATSSGAKHPSLLPSDLYALFSTSSSASTAVSSNRPLNLGPHHLDCLPLPPSPFPLQKLPTNVTSNLFKGFDHFPCQ